MPVLDALGVAIAVPDEVDDALASLPSTARAAVATITERDPGLALTELTRLAVAHTTLLCIHAAVVRGPAGLIVIPGRSGLGKTTLTAALLRAGFEYVSDEALAVDTATGCAMPFPRPLGLAADVWGLLGLTGEPPSPGAERLVAPQVFGRVAESGGRVSHVVLAERGSEPLLLERTERTEAVAALLRRSFNHYRDPEGSLRTVLAVVRGAQIWRAQYQDAPQLAALIAARLAPPAQPSDGRPQ
ncbi:MAG TPA: hypothetical protein VH395_08705 [Jatrophihabitantaceae bacterium]